LPKRIRKVLTLRVAVSDKKEEGKLLPTPLLVTSGDEERRPGAP